MMRVSPETVEKVRARAAELIRGKVDSWRRTILVEKRPGSGREAALAEGKDCFPVKAFLDILDGRTIWRDRELADQQVNRCLHCLDHFSADGGGGGLLRTTRPLSDAGSGPVSQAAGSRGKAVALVAELTGCGEMYQNRSLCNASIRITWNPNRMNGQPCIRDMRLTVRRAVEAVALYPKPGRPV